MNGPHADTGSLPQGPWKGPFEAHVAPTLLEAVI
jgi:hypothetical protein